MVYRLKECRFGLWRRLVQRMIVKKLKACSWGYFYYLTLDKKYVTNPSLSLVYCDPHSPTSTYSPINKPTLTY